MTARVSRSPRRERSSVRLGVRTKLIALVVAAGVIPIALLSATTLETNRDALERYVAMIELAKAGEAAARAGAVLDGIDRQLALLAGQTIRWNELTPAERRGAVWLIYRQIEDAAAVVLVDRSGAVVEQAWVDGSSPPEEQRGRVFGGATLVEALAGLPAADTPSRIGKVLAGVEGPVVPWIMPVAGPNGASWLAIAAVSLRGVCRTFGPIAGEPGAVVRLLDADSRDLCRAGLEPIAADAALAAALPSDSGAWRYRDGGGVEWAAAGRRFGPGWMVVAEQHVTAAFAVGKAIRDHALAWIALSVAIALLAGSYLARGISRPIARLAAGARELARGNLGHRIGTVGGDELGDLAETFDHMSDEVAKRNAVIASHAAELEQRVEERTRELEDAYRVLVRSHRIAAMSSFGSSIAQEIHAPLTSVLGITQLLQQRAETRHDKDAHLLGKAVREGLRIRELLKRLATLSQKLSEQRLKEVRVHDLLDSTLRVATHADGGGAERLVRDYADDELVVRGGFSALQQALLGLLQAARSNAGPDGAVTVRTRCDGERVDVEIHDDGPALAPERLERLFEPAIDAGHVDSDGGALAYAIAYRIVHEHHGSIAARADAGGTVITMTLPLSRVSSAAPSAPARDAVVPAHDAEVAS